MTQAAATPYSEDVLIVATITATVAALLAVLAGLALVRAPHGSPQRVLAPAQIAAAAILAAGAASELFAPAGIGLATLVICVVVALATIGAAAWQLARYVEAYQRAPATDACATSCGGCASSGSLCAKP